MKDSYKMIFIGYVLLALKIFNILIFQILGLLGYLLIGVGLWHVKDGKHSKIAAFAAFGLFLLTGFEFVRHGVVAESIFDIILAIIQLGLYIFLNWILLFYMFDDILHQFKCKKMIDDAQICEKKKTKFMNLLFYSVLLQNAAFMFPKLGAIIFLIGTILAIYLAFSQAIYMRKVASVL